MACNGEINPPLRRCQIKKSGATIFTPEPASGVHAMSDQTVAAIARDLAKAMLTRARTRLPDDQKVVLALQTKLVAEISAEQESASLVQESAPGSLVLN
jgi:hypothetical protein